MIHTFIGNLGHIFIIASFVFSFLSAGLYIKAVLSKGDTLRRDWQINARTAFYIHSIAVIGAIASLFFIIYNHYFEYHYAWSHSSRSLPVHYMISCFWEGQEGSFLLWIFWHVILGLILIRTNKKWESPVMAVFAMVQAFLTSMILGVVIFDVKIGSSPFILLRDALDAPIFQTNPDFVPEDGTGLNPLLQNYWMVIHPPFLFMGFAATLVPFAYLIAGLWTKRYTEWVRPALPWSLFAAAVLGTGILMGAYWAYETLNFGGYWNWDPVENAVYIPWLVLLAAIHVMALYRKNKAGLRTAAVLIVASFILILYSTFLTRSGILGSASVHSFTDLGLMQQLIIYLFFFLAVAVAFLIARWKKIPATTKEINLYSPDLWIFLGVATLCLMGFQVLIPTSYPVINSILQGIGIDSNLALPVDQVVYYSRIQMWFAIVIAILSGTAQFFWWKKMSKKNLLDEIGLPLIVTLIVSIVIILAGGIDQAAYILLVTAAVYVIVTNGRFVIHLLKTSGRMKISGGAVAHMGMALMLIGILFSSGYSSIISQNRSGKIYSKEFSDEMNQENVLLWLEEPLKMNDYELVYKGPRIAPDNFPGYVDKTKVLVFDNERIAIVLDSIRGKGGLTALPGDTLELDPENTYYEVQFRQENGRSFTLYPRAQVNPNMGLIASPDIKKYLNKDLYMHVSSIPDPEHEKEWSEMKEHVLPVGKQFFVNDHIAELLTVYRVENLKRVALDTGDVAVKARIRVLGKEKAYIAEPVYFIKDRKPGIIPDFLPELGARFSLMNINPDSGEFTIGVETTQRDYIILKAMEKPHINILWLGTGVLVLGFGIAAARRYKEYKHEREKEETPQSKKMKKTRKDAPEVAATESI